MNVLVIKLGALGDVVRTSYILDRLRGLGARLAWVTADAALPLLECNPNLDDLIPWSVAKAELATGGWLHRSYDWIISLDDEVEACKLCSDLKPGKLTGAYLDACGNVTYTQDSSLWFDMGLVSRLGKGKADHLKRVNQKSHDEIFCEMLGLPPLAPKLYLSPHWHIAADEILEDLGRPCLGLNLSAGKRWPAKRLPLAEAVKLVVLLKATGVGMILLGGKDDFAYLEVIAKSTGCPILPEIPLGLFAAVVGRLQEIISSDSLALHLAIAQAVPSVSFYAPTSAAEINTFGFGIKVLSTAADYCSYKPDADNSSLTAERVFSAWNDLTGKKHHSIFS